MTEDHVLKRKDAHPESLWSGDRVFASWKEWEAEYQTVQEHYAGLAKFSGKLLTSPAVLVEWMGIVNDLSLKTGRLAMFARFATTVDGSDIEAKTALGQAASLQAQFAAATSFSVPELVQDAEKLRSWSENEPELKLFAHFFDNLIRQQKHLRSAEVEEILSMVNEPFVSVNHTFTELVNNDLAFDEAVDSHGKPYMITQSTFSSSLQSEDRKRRKTAWENYMDSYLSMQNTLAANYIAWIKQQVFMARVRGYSSVLEMRLSPFNLPLEVFHNLIDTFKKNLPVWHRYWDVKREALGLEEIRPYDLWAPVGKNPPVVPYPKAVDWICDSLAILGDEYAPVMRRGALEDRWVDWAPNIEKRQGAASWRRYLMPPWIFMSYNNSVFSLSTLAHELGHSMHTYLASEKAYLREIKKNDPNFMVAMVEEAMANFHRYFFIMPTLARFEYEVFTRAEQGKPLSVKIFNELMSELFAEGYGETLKTDPKRTGITWATFLHLYMPFYTFQYAIGISAAHALGSKVLSGDAGASENYLKFLKAGGSRYTMDLFNLAGVDMTTPAPVISAYKDMEENIDLLEEYSRLQKE
jgi:oligoendopeptidase F